MSTPTRRAHGAVGHSMTYDGSSINGQQKCHIAVKEMLPIVMAATVWGKFWQGLSIRFNSDNTAVVALLNAGSVKHWALMHLMRCLTFLAAKFNFVISAAHIKGVDNTLADALSRDVLRCSSA